MHTQRRPTKKSRTMAELPSEGDLIAFNYNAAGHEGISSNASGSLVIKPCTQAEIDFYESAQYHEHFQAHMPVYMGTLILNQDQDSVAPLLQQSQGSAPLFGLQNQAQQPTGVIAGMQPPTSAIQLLSHQNPGMLISQPNPPNPSKRMSWKPSGGKKLNTGLAVVLENVAAGFKHPNILDVKLGARLWDDDAPAAKRKKLDDVANVTTSGSLGIRVAGMKLWLGANAEETLSKRGSAVEKNTAVKDDYLCYDKNYGREFKDDNIKDAFTTYLGGTVEEDKNAHHHGSRTSLKRKRGRLVAERLLRELESAQYVLENEESRMYSASILMVYEGDEEALEAALRGEEEEEDQRIENTAKAEMEVEVEGAELADEDDDEEDDDSEVAAKVHDLRLIDFAHARWTPGQGPDENSLHGIRSVVRILKEILAD